MYQELAETYLMPAIIEHSKIVTTKTNFFLNRIVAEGYCLLLSIIKV